MTSDHRDDSFFFIQMSDPQFGMYAALSGSDEAKIEEFRRKRLIVRPAPKTYGFAFETRLYRKAVDKVLRLRPEFVVVCGDMVHDSNDPEQLAELMSITGDLSGQVPVRWVCGNHDVGNDLTPASRELYRRRFGRDQYHFDHHGTRFIVLNSNIAFNPSGVPGAWDEQLEFLDGALDGAEESGSTRTVAFTHHPLFLEEPDEPDSTLTIPRERRDILLERMKARDAWGMFSGHWHRNSYASDGDFQMVTSAAVGYPMGDDPSGFRIVKVYPDRIEHQYFGFDDVPESVEL